MYMLVFVTLIVALIGTYSQMLAIQTARLASGQTTIASAMLAWHSTAVSQARYAGIPTPPAAGCSLTSNGALIAQCKNIAGNVITIDGAVTLGLCGANPPPCWTKLPQGYNVTPYTFHSIYYNLGGQSYIITFVPPPTVTAANPAPGFIVLPALGGNLIGATMSDLALQFKNKNMSAVSYGTFASVGAGVSNLITSPISNGNGLASSSYPLPAVLDNPAFIGSIGIISTP